MKTAFRLIMTTLLFVSAASLLEAQAPAVNHNTWTSGAAMPTGVFCSMAGVLSGEVYVVGGQDSSGTVVADTQIYNLKTNTWSAGVPLPAPVWCGATAVVENVLYIFGGYPTAGTGTTTNAVWAYSPKTKTWTAKAAMPTARGSVGAVADKNIIYVIGGYNGSRLATVESYNPATNTWTEETPLLDGKSEPSLGVFGSTIVAADGYTSGGDNGDNEGYSTTTNAWKAFKADPTARKPDLRRRHRRRLVPRWWLPRRPARNACL